MAQVFKETLTLAAVGRAMELGVRAAGFEPVVVLASDGGDGLLEALAGEFTRRSRHTVTGPLGWPVSVEVGWLDRATAVIESRLVCGLSVVPVDQRDPRRTTTRGVGELLSAVVSEGASRVLVGLGGSATMDGGTGMARAWGWSFLDAAGAPLPEGGGSLPSLAEIRPGTPPALEITALLDVSHPLTGPQGAAQFAAQKGATPAAATALTRGLERLVEAVGPGGAAEVATRPGAGAAGGLGYGLMVFAGAGAVPGAEWMLARRGFDRLLTGAVAVLVGEGRFDATSLGGKLTGVVLERAAAAGVPGVLVAPTVAAQPPGQVIVETGGGQWNARELERRVHQALARLSRP